MRLLAGSPALGEKGPRQAEPLWGRKLPYSAVLVNDLSSGSSIPGLFLEDIAKGPL